MDLMMIIVTVVSLAVAVTMSIVAARTVRAERQRSDARVAALAADIQEGDAVEAAPARARTFDDLHDDGTSATSEGHLFHAPPTMPARSRLAVVLMLGALIVATGVSLAVVFAGAGTRSSVVKDGERIERTHADTVPPTAGPLELVALGHERDGNSLTVRGVLRNPASGVEVHQLIAVVLMFNHDGGFVASGRAPVQAITLEPGRETTFVVSLPSAAGVDRYRVSFRTEDRVVPHLDVRS